MELLETNITDIDDNRKRITGLVQYNDGETEEYWYEYPAEFNISETGNPWLVALLPVAAYLGEDLTISLPIDPKLMDATEDVLSIWSTWWGDYMSKINVIAKNGVSIIGQFPKEEASLFSSGVDAYFTAYRKERAKYKILIQGFDFSVDKKGAFGTHRNRIARIVEEMGQALVDVASNYRKTRAGQLKWEKVSHGPFLASVMLMFEQHFCSVYLPANFGSYGTIGPYGTNPLFDPLYSTSRTNIIQDGIDSTRLDKMRYLSQHDFALKNIHVCIRGQDKLGQDEKNCCHCHKCYMTMAAMELAGVLDKCSLFDKDKFDVSRIKYIFVDAGPDLDNEYRTMEKAAIELGRHDIASGIRKCLRRSKLLLWSRRFDKTPIFWRIPQYLMKNTIY